MLAIFSSEFSSNAAQQYQTNTESLYFVSTMLPLYNSFQIQLVKLLLVHCCIRLMNMWTRTSEVTIATQPKEADRKCIWKKKTKIYMNKWSATRIWEKAANENDDRGKLTDDKYRKVYTLSITSAFSEAYGFRNGIWLVLFGLIILSLLCGEYEKRRSTITVNTEIISFNNCNTNK